MAEAGGRVVAVLGYSGPDDGDLHPVCAERVSHAERLAAGARAVIVSGFARRAGRPAEAERMCAAWAGPDVPLMRDAIARTTAQNAGHVAAAAATLGADELVVVTSRWHRPRARVLVWAAARGSGVRTSVVGAPGPLRPRAIARELACVALLPYHLVVARRAAHR